MENRLNDVLVLTPLTEEGKIVLKQAMNLQKLVPYRIFAVNIIPAVSLFMRLFGLSKTQRLKEENALKRLTGFLTGFYGGKIPENVIPLVLSGNLVRTLIKQAQSGGFYFLILKRSKHKNDIPNILKKNELNKVIAHSFSPVLLVNEDSSAENLENILVPLDISENTEKKLLWASLFAKKAKAKIQIVSALSLNIDKYKSQTTQNAGAIKEMLLKRGIKSEIEILKASKKDKTKAVLHFMETKKTDIVIIRKHQVASVTNTTIGDFAKEIINKSKAPVFIVSQSQGDISKFLH